MDKVVVLRHLYAMLDAVMSLKHHSKMLAKDSEIAFPNDADVELESLTKEIMSTIIMLVEHNPVREREHQINAIFEAAMRRSSNAHTDI